MIKQYVPTDYKQTFIDTELMNIDTSAVKYVENGTICVDAVKFNGHVYDANGVLCTHSMLERHNGVGRPIPFKAATDFINENVVFLGGGYVFCHFGHFLLEGLSRAYPALDAKFKDKKFVVVVRRGTKRLPSYVMTLLGGLGIAPENIILINKTTRFAGIYVPPQGSVITKSVSPIMKQVFDTIANNLSDANIKTYDKIYLSRSKMNDGRTFGESAVENIFAKNGYKIIWPETLSISEQITLAQNCRVMAGTAGTALHLAMFMRPGGTVVQIKRNSSLDDNISTQKTICDVCGLDLIYIAGSIEKTPTGHFTSVPQIIGVTEYLKQFFDDNKFKYTDTDIEFDKNAWAQYLRQLGRYNRKHMYDKAVGLLARIIAIFGITKYGRQIIREFIKRALRVN